MSEPRPAIGTRPSCASDLEFLARVYQGTREEELSSLGWSAAQQQAFARMQFDVRRRYYRITKFGRSVAMAESARYAKLLSQARANGLTPKRT